MKEQTRNTAAQTNEEEIGKLPGREFRIMKVKMIENLKNIMERMEYSINKYIEELKNKHKKQTTQLRMGEQVEYAFLPRRNTNGQQARRCRRYLTSWVIKDRQFKTTIRDYFPLTSMTRIKKSDKNKRWR